MASTNTVNTLLCIPQCLLLFSSFLHNYIFYQVIHEPWWVTAQIAEVYAFKLNYDRKVHP